MVANGVSFVVVENAGIVAIPVGGPVFSGNAPDLTQDLRY